MMKRLLLAALAAGAVLAITYYAYNVGPVGVVNGILAILLLLRLLSGPSRPVRAVDGAGTVPASLGPSRREWPSQGLVRGGMAMLVTRQICGEARVIRAASDRVAAAPAQTGGLAPQHGVARVGWVYEGGVRRGRSGSGTLTR